MALNPTDCDPNFMEQNFGTKCLITSPAADRYLEKTKKVEKPVPPEDSYSRWCGGKGGFDLFVERIHE